MLDFDVHVMGNHQKEIGEKFEKKKFGLDAYDNRLV